MKDYFGELARTNPKKHKRIQAVLKTTVFILIGFLIGLISGNYIGQRKVSPLKIDLGGLEKSVIQSDELKDKLRWDKEVHIYDLRKKEDYDAGHISHAVSMPVGELAIKYSEIPKEKEVVIYCQNFSCEEAPQATMILDAAKYKNFRTLFGGLEEWVNQGNKLVRD